jgi:hypothetical protein
MHAGGSSSCVNDFSTWNIFSTERYRRLWFTFFCLIPWFDLIARIMRSLWRLDREDESDAAREKFFVPESDHLTLLNVYQQWKQQNYSSSWWSIFSYVLPFAVIKAIVSGVMTTISMQKQWRKLEKCMLSCWISWSLRRYLTYESKLAHVWMMYVSQVKLSSSKGNWDAVRKAICSSYFYNSARIKGNGLSITVIQMCDADPTTIIHWPYTHSRRNILSFIWPYFYPVMINLWVPRKHTSAWWHDYFE